MSSLGMAAQFNATKFPFRRLSLCSASATNSFPDPVGPFIITGESEAATRAIIFFKSTVDFDCPIILASSDVMQTMPFFSFLIKRLVYRLSEFQLE